MPVSIMPRMTTRLMAIKRKSNQEIRMRMLLTTMTLVALASSAAFAADVKAGQAVYDKSCKSCHGADGKANPAIAKMMSVDIPDLKSSEVQGLGDDVIKKVITDGKGKMKPIKTVSGAALDDVVAYVHSMKK